MAARKRRGPKHPGVVLIKPNAARRSGWIGRYKDPDTGKTRQESLPSELTTLEQREDWAVRKSKELTRRRHDIEGGDPRRARKPFDEAIKGYYAVARNRLRPQTLGIYERATALLEEWAKSARLTHTSDLTAVKLPAFRDYLLARKKHARIEGGKRGETRAAKEKLAPQTINWQLRAVKTVLNHLRMRGQVPLSRDAISDALKPAPVPRDAPEFLRPADCARLLEAALRHDAETFAATREEHAGLRPVGTTPRYEPIAPFIACVLLTGMRLGEALALKWADIDLTARDSDGQVAGEIRLRADATKTGHARVIDLGVCPQLRSLLAVTKLRAGDATYVFGGKAPMARTLAESSRKRLIGTFGAPEFSWQLLRSTCATIQCNAPGIFGAAAAFVSAKRLGHSVMISERLYADLHRVSREARTLEAAMQIEGVMGRLTGTGESTALDLRSRVDKL